MRHYLWPTVPNETDEPVCHLALFMSRPLAFEVEDLGVETQ